MREFSRLSPQGKAGEAGGSKREDRARETERLLENLEGGQDPEGCFDGLFRRFYPPVRAFFLKRGFSRSAAEDLAQDTFIRVYRSIGGYRREASFETWLFRIAGNVWKNKYRHRSAKKRQADVVSLDDLEERRGQEQRAAGREPQARSTGPLADILADEKVQALRRELLRLPDKMQECVLLRLNQDRSYQEIADLMGVSKSTVKWQLKEAKKRLRPALEGHFGDLSL